MIQYLACLPAPTQSNQAGTRLTLYPQQLSRQTPCGTKRPIYKARQLLYRTVYHIIQRAQHSGPIVPIPVRCRRINLHRGRHLKNAGTAQYTIPHRHNQSDRLEEGSLKSNIKKGFYYHSSQIYPYPPQPIP